MAFVLSNRIRLRSQRSREKTVQIEGSFRAHPVAVEEDEHYEPEITLHGLVNDVPEPIGREDNSSSTALLVHRERKKEEHCAVHYI